MFNDRPSNDAQNGGKRVSYTKKPDSFSIGWAVEQTNTGSRKKQQEIQSKVGAPGTQSVTQSAQRSQKEIQREPQREKESYRQPEPTVQKQKKPQYTEKEVLESLRKYEKLADMPQDELDKVLLYYEDMKHEQSQPQQEPEYSRYEQQPRYEQSPRFEQQNQQSYQPQSYSNHEEPYAPSSSNSIETRQPIRPKDSIKGLINNQPIQSSQGSTRYSQKNKSTLTLGDGYNPFSNQAPKQSKKTEFERIQDNQKKPPATQGYKISNIFG